MKPIRLGVSALTNTIFAGTLLKGDKIWAVGKQDVTDEACEAVADHLLRKGAPYIISIEGVPTYAISVSLVDIDTV